MLDLSIYIEAVKSRIKVLAVEMGVREVKITFFQPFHLHTNPIKLL